MSVAQRRQTKAGQTYRYCAQHRVICIVGRIAWCCFNSIMRFDNWQPLPIDELTPEREREIIAEGRQLLDDWAAGKFGPNP
jgi:hypothetical protein